ncbi:ABC transporter permease [Bdellovibrio sp. HCB337]|uniref:ABC transporter permease n=1 Tax=Bdellovibrio sp. HCB337 TaxID=3394358 RepID=UPI0039A6A2AE
MSESLLLIFSLLLAGVRMATPMIFASMGGLMSERSGVVNIALEGFMLTGAFVAAVVAYYTHSEWLGWALAVAAGCCIGALYAFFVIELKADQIVTGTAINILTIGVMPFLTKILFNSTGSTPGLPLEDRFSFEPMLLAFVLVAGVTYWFYQTHSGLWVQFAGEHPEALESAGVSVRKVRWFSVIISGAFAALGGASLSTFLASSYSPLMTGGRGFMALAALIFGRWKPIPTFAACVFFGVTDALQIRLQGVSIGDMVVPVQFIQILPYVVTIIALAGFFGKSEAPKSLGKVLE